MPSRFENRVHRLQDKYGDALLTSLTVLLLLMFVVAPLRAAGFAGVQVLALVLIVALMANALVLSGNLTSFVIMLIALAMNAAAIIRRAEHQSTVNIDLLAGAWLILALTLAWIVARAVFGPGRVNYHRVVGAILLYLLIALDLRDAVRLRRPAPRGRVLGARARRHSCARQQPDLLQLRHPDLDRLRRHRPGPSDRAQPVQRRDHHRPALSGDLAGAAGDARARAPALIGRAAGARR